MWVQNCFRICIVSETASSWRKRRGGGAAIQHASPVVPASVPSLSNQNQFLSHSVDKMFEEAELSGVLLLNGRKLKEFPSELASKFDISDVIFADLSENRLNELPLCICKLGSLETLCIRSAGLRTIPNFQMLSSLTYLDLSCNHLTALPPEICSLPLQVLLLTGNLLETLPREIRQLADTLNELDVSCNRLRTIPVDVALLKSLRVLNLRANCLSHLPSELSRLELRILNVSENELSQLPCDLCCMPSLIEFYVDANPFVAPPVKVCLKGREHIFKWLRAKAAPLNDGFSKQFDWHQRPVSVAVNATMRRPKHQEIFALVIFLLAESELHPFAKRVERRNRSTRFNTLGGSDSGYASTADEHRLSNEYQLSVNNTSLFGINESLRSPPSDRDSPKSTGMNSSGDRTITSECSSPITEDSTGLLKEVMLAYAEKMGETASEVLQKNKSLVTQRDSVDHANFDEMTFIPRSTVIPVSVTSNISYSAPPNRPQAIVSPMNSKPQAQKISSNGVNNLYFKAIKSDNVVHIIDESEDVKKAVLVSSVSNGVLDESNNNTSEDNIKENQREETLQKHTRIGTSCNTLAKGFGKELLGKQLLSVQGFETSCTNSRQLQRKQLVNNDNECTLSPVIEMPASSENGNKDQDCCSSTASCINPSPASFATTTVPCGSAAASVTSTIKVPATKKKNLSGSVSASMSRLSLSSASADRSSIARNTALRRPTTSSEIASRIASRPNTSVHLSHSKDSKLTKTRDSIGIARRHLVNNSSSSSALRKSSVVGRTQFDESGSNTTISGTSLIRRNIENMRKILESRLETVLSANQEQLANQLSDGTLLCNFANRVRGRIISNVLMPASQQAQLSLPKCRRNAENFLFACRRIGVAEVVLLFFLFWSACFSFSRIIFKAAIRRIYS
uniref:Calponin-homology (CH) domain-containing protein n=1 Tax=Syphacia muris TaxID=451379 RepID=A0A0N5AI04_9BILA